MNKKPKIKIIGAELQDIIKSVSPEATLSFHRKPYAATYKPTNQEKKKVLKNGVNI